MKSETELKRDKAALVWARAERMAREAWSAVRVAKQVAIAVDKLEGMTRLDMEQAMVELERERVDETWSKLTSKEGGE
jgi:hypothetical protein